MRDDGAHDGGNRIRFAVADGDGFRDFVVSRDIEDATQEFMRVYVRLVVKKLTLQKKREGNDEQPQKNVDDGATFVYQLLSIVHIRFPAMDDGFNSTHYNLAH